MSILIHARTSYLFIVVIMFHISAQAIQETRAHIYTALLAVVCVGSSYKIVYNTSYKIHPVILGVASCAATAAAHHYLQKITPAGRIRRANILLNELSRHTLAKICFDNDRLFFDAVQDVYLTDDLWMISAYNHLIDLVPTVHYALSLINKALAEVGKDVLLREECDASLSRANRLFKNISDAIKRIREHKDYLAQLSIYKESLMQAQYTIAQQQMAAAHQQVADAQQSNVLLKWLKALLLWWK